MTAWLVGFKDLFLLLDYMYMLVVDPPKLEWSKLMWVLRTELRLSTEKYTLKCQLVLPCFFVIYVLACFWDRVSCIPGWLTTSQVLGEQICASMTSLYFRRRLGKDSNRGATFPAHYTISIKWIADTHVLPLIMQMNQNFMSNILRMKRQTVNENYNHYSSSCLLPDILY